MSAERDSFQEYFKTTWEGIDLVQTVGEQHAFEIENDKYIESVVEEHWVTWRESASRDGHRLIPIDDLEVVSHWAEMMGYEYGNDDAVESALIIRNLINM